MEFSKGQVVVGRWWWVEKAVVEKVVEKAVVEKAVVEKVVEKAVVEKGKGCCVLLNFAPKSQELHIILRDDH
jgi:hypothetical protein